MMRKSQPQYKHKIKTVWPLSWKTCEKCKRDFRWETMYAHLWFDVTPVYYCRGCSSDSLSYLDEVIDYEYDRVKTRPDTPPPAPPMRRG